MQISQRVIQLAKERAVYAFSVLAQNMLTDGLMALERPTQSVRAATDAKLIADASRFLLRDGRAFTDRLSLYYGDYLERAMKTMYRDLRANMSNLSADNLSLIDDDTMTRQIEVDRLVVRMRDTDPENLGRINLIIAQIHGDHDVRERENPFRPYLLARSLHEVLAGMVKDDAVARLLFSTLAEIMLQRLPNFYAGIREVFESNGIRSRLLARPASMTRRQREMLDGNVGFNIGQVTPEPGDPALARREAEMRIQAGLQRLAETRKGEGADTALPTGETIEQRVALQDFVWQMFQGQRPAAARPGAPPLAEPEVVAARTRTGSLPPDFAVELIRLQRQSAQSRDSLEERTRLSALRDRMESANVAPRDRMVAEVVSLLFEYVFQDEQIPRELRHDLYRLQVPFLRAALLTPELTQQPMHPARVFLNRLASVAAALDPANDGDQKIAAEISLTINRILEQFEDDMVVFTNCLEDFEEFMVSHYRSAGPAGKDRVAAMEEAERTSVYRYNLENTLRDLLPPFEMDSRVHEFVAATWTRVLARLLALDSEGGDLMSQYRNVLPELVWSVQPKLTTPDRSALMKLLPDLVRRLKQGLELAGIPDDEARRALDHLADVHMQILRMAARSGSKPSMALEEVYQHFAMLQVCEGSYLWAESEPLQVLSETVHAAFAGRGATAHLQVQNEAIPALATDQEWMAQMQLGIGADVQVGEDFELARLSWISEQRSLFLFALERGGEPFVYSGTSLLKGMRDGHVRPLEAVPLFERAVESLVAGAGRVQSS